MQKEQETNMDQPVAEYEVGKGLLFSASLGDLMETTSESDVTDLDEKNSLKGPTDVEVDSTETSDSDDSTDSTESEQEDKYSDYSDSALYALALEEKRPGLFGDVPKDLSPESFLEVLDTRITEAMDNAREAAVASVSEGAEYIDLILNSPDLEHTQGVVRQAHAYDVLSSLDVDTAENEDLELLIKEMHALKEVAEEDSKELIETYKDTGKLKAKAQEAKTFLKNLKDTLVNQEKAQQEQFRKSFEENRKLQKQKIEEVISSGSIIGIPVPKEKQERFRKWMYSPTEVVEYTDRTGKKVTQRVSKGQKAIEEFNRDVEKQLGMYLLIMDNFKFTPLEEKAKEERDNEILAHLGNRGKGSKPSKQKPRNAFYEMS